MTNSFPSKQLAHDILAHEHGIGCDDEKVQLDKLSRIVCSSKVFKAILDSFEGYVLILDAQHRVLVANDRAIKDFGAEALVNRRAVRPGDMLGCVHAASAPNGCGTSNSCATCGALMCLGESMRCNEPVSGECRATICHQGELQAREFRVRATPIEVEGQYFIIFVMHDISGEKRRDVLERVFYHDIMNTLGGLIGWSDMLRMKEPVNDPHEIAEYIYILSNRMHRLVEDQRQLMQAERGELKVERKSVAVAEVLNQLKTTFAVHESAKDKNLIVAPLIPGEAVWTDRVLLLRVLINMVKNALEATEAGGTVDVRFEREANGAAVFLVHNESAIPPNVAAQIFQRSFSTKAQTGRGIGAYSMKLFGERYLGGQVGFSSNAEKGTIFHIRLPALPKDVY